MRRRRRERRRFDCSDSARDHEQQAKRCDHLAEPQPGSRPRVRRERHGRQREHQVCDDHADSCPGELGAEVGAGSSRRSETAERCVTDRDDRIEMRSRHRPDGNDDRGECRAGCRGVFKQLQADIAWAQPLRRNAGTDDCERAASAVPTNSAHGAARKGRLQLPQQGSVDATSPAQHDRSPCCGRLERSVRKHRVHLPTRVGARDPDLVLERVAAGDAVLDLGRQPLGSETASGRDDLASRSTPQRRGD